MNAHPVLLQKKYARIIAGFAEKEKMSLENALDFFINLSCINSLAKAFPICIAEVTYI